MPKWFESSHGRTDALLALECGSIRQLSWTQNGLLSDLIKAIDNENEAQGKEEEKEAIRVINTKRTKRRQVSKFARECLACRRVEWVEAENVRGKQIWNKIRR